MTKVVEKIRTQILHAITFFPKTVLFMKQCAKVWYIYTRYRWQCNMPHVLCVPDA